MMARGKKQPVKRQSKRIKDAKQKDNNTPSSVSTPNTSKTKKPTKKTAKKVGKNPGTQKKKKEDHVVIVPPPPPGIR